MNAAEIAHVLGGATRNGRGWVCRCPVHEDRNPSLSLADGENGRLLVTCWAGCPPRDVLAALHGRGLLAGKYNAPDPRPRQARDTKTGKDISTARMEAAMRLWQSSRPVVAGCPVEIYLRWRGIIMPQSPALRYHPALKHPGGGYWPGMVSLVQRGQDGQPIGIHRTFLAKGGKCKAPVKPDKMMLGVCHAGAVRLAEAGGIVMTGEGIETCLAAMQGASLPAWAALSTSGLRMLDLPPAVREVIVLADGDDPGEQAAQAAALRWAREGRKVRIARPPRGFDFNDVLLGRAAGGTA